VTFKVPAAAEDEGVGGVGASGVLLEQAHEVASAAASTERTNTLRSIFTTPDRLSETVERRAVNRAPDGRDAAADDTPSAASFLPGNSLFTELVRNN
jgi:hypothetical protein